MDVFRSGTAQEMRTSQIFSELEKISGTLIPAQSVYQALRTLVRRKVLSVRKQGRERLYAMVGTAPARAAKSSRATTPKEPPMPKVVEETAVMVAAVAPAPAAPAPETAVSHKLVPGEIVILEVGESHLEVATNVHGKLVVERHKRQRK